MEVKQKQSAHCNKSAAESSLQQLNIRTIPISQIKCAAYNPRKEFTKAELKSFEADLDRFSCIEPLIWNERTGNLVGGHKRFSWLEKRGVKKIKVNVVNLSENEEKLLNLALNRQGEGLWDWGKLDLMIEEIKLDELDLGLTGFEIQLEKEDFELEYPDPKVKKKIVIKLVCKRTNKEAIEAELGKIAKIYPGTHYYIDV